MQRTPLPALDAALRGGLLAGTLTELTGASGAGKTQVGVRATRSLAVGADGLAQFCTAMAVEVALGGGEAGGSVLYVDSEGAFTAERLLQMMRPAAAVRERWGLGGLCGGAADVRWAQALVPPADVAGLVVRCPPPPGRGRGG